jgi:SAM-dependent methyltransferase
MNSTDHPSLPHAGQITPYTSNQNELLGAFSTRDIIVELLHRTQSVQASTQELAFLGHQLWSTLLEFADVHSNRHSITNLKNVYIALARPNIAQRLPIRDATWVELGCGSINPWSFSFLLLALGAKQAIPIDLDPIADPSAACGTLAEMAKCLLINPALIVGTADLITPQEIFENLRDFDFEEIDRGSITGIPDLRLSYRAESVYDMSVPESSVDVVVSNAFLEHVPDVDGAIKAIARITKPGGFGVHIIDTIDH